MSSHRFLFYVPELQRDHRVATLVDTEHHHATRVLRVRTGDVAFVTDGNGLIVRGAVASVDRAECSIRIDDIERDRPPGRRLALALALIRRERFEQAVEQCTELGITDVIPFVSVRSQTALLTEEHRARLERIVIGAMKQSFHGIRPRIASPVGFDGLLAVCDEFDHTVVGDPAGGAEAPHSGGDTVVVVGPEAGLDRGERAALVERGAFLVSASAHRLRSETAAVALLARLNHYAD